MGPNWFWWLSMPNYVYNHVCIKGTSDALRVLAEQKLSFRTLHPVPAGVNEFNWCCSHWGTKWDAASVDLSVSDGCLEATFETPWAPPHGFLAYLTLMHSGLTIENEFQEESAETVGITQYFKGNITNQQIHPVEYSAAALQAFEKEVDWYIFDEDAPRTDEKTEVEIEEWSVTYDEFVAENEKALS